MAAWRENCGQREQTSTSESDPAASTAAEEWSVCVLAGWSAEASHADPPFRRIPHPVRAQKRRAARSTRISGLHLLWRHSTTAAEGDLLCAGRIRQLCSALTAAVRRGALETAANVAPATGRQRTSGGSQKQQLRDSSQSQRIATHSCGLARVFSAKPPFA